MNVLQKLPYITRLFRCVNTEGEVGALHTVVYECVLLFTALTVLFVI